MLEQRGPLTADFHRYYGLSLARISDYGIPLHEVAAMAAYLPIESATFRAIHEDWQGDINAELLRSMEFSLRWLLWAKTKDGSKGKNIPGPILFPWEDDPNAPIKGDVMTQDEAAAWLGWDVPR